MEWDFCLFERESVLFSTFRMTWKNDFEKSYLQNETKRRCQTLCICFQFSMLLPEMRKKNVIHALFEGQNLRSNL
jgi:hypothetical protein